MNKRQKEAARYIQNLLDNRGIEYEYGILDVLEQPCIILEKDHKYIAVDPGSGIWTGSEGKWNQIEQTYTLSGVLVAIEFLA